MLARCDASGRFALSTALGLRMHADAPGAAPRSRLPRGPVRGITVSDDDGSNLYEARAALRPCDLRRDESPDRRSKVTAALGLHP
jgi:hypothetical protein